MDIRDITEDVKYPGIGALGDIFALQKVILDHYIGIEGLPPYPLDINIKASQSLIKDFSGRIIEEIGEGFESYQIMLNLFHSGAEDSELIPHLQNFNEEIADALHFWLELMVFSGFEWEKLKVWMELEWGMELTQPDLLNEYLKTGAYIGEMELNMMQFKKRMVIKDEDLKDEFLRGGRAISSSIFKQMKVFAWDITYHLQIARNTLKNKPWKQTQMMTDEKLYEEEIKKATFALFKFLWFCGFTKESLYVIYYKKNKVNQFRIKSKY
jgi:hypothetical protein